MKNRTRILITGGNGFIGARLRKELEKSPENEVWVLEPEASGRPGAKTIARDVRDSGLDLSDFDVVYHLAAIASPKRCEQDRENAWSVNVEGTRNIAERVGKGAKLVFMSSAHVYPRDGKVHKETDKPGPQSFYGMTKLAGEEMVKQLAKRRGFKYVIFRLFSSYSADQPEGFLVPDVIRKYRTAHEVSIMNAGAKIDLVHVDDVVSVLAKAGSMNGTYNLCSSKPVTIAEVYKRIRKHVGTAPKERKEAGPGTGPLGSNRKIAKLGFKFREFSLP